MADTETRSGYLFTFVRVILFLVAFVSGFLVQNYIVQFPSDAHDDGYTTYNVFPFTPPFLRAWERQNTDTEETPAEPSDAQDSDSEDGSVNGQDDSKFQFSVTPGMYLISFIMVGYALIEWILCRFANIKVDPDRYYYLGFLLTISAISIAMSAMPEMPENRNDGLKSMVDYIDKIVNETGAAVWSTILGLILRFVCLQGDTQPRSGKGFLRNWFILPGWLQGKCLRRSFDKPKTGQNPYDPPQYFQEQLQGHENHDHTPRWFADGRDAISRMVRRLRVGI